MLSNNEVTEGMLIAVLGSNFVLLFFIAWHVATARLYSRQVHRLAMAIVRKMDCDKLIDEMLSCSGEPAEKQRHEGTAGDSLASPDASSGGGHEVTGQSGNSRRRLTGCKNTMKGSPRLQRGVKQGGMGYLLTEKHKPPAISRSLMILK